MGHVLEENLSSGVWQAGAPNTGLHSSSCVTLGKGLNIPGLLFPHLLSGGNHLVPQSQYEDSLR